MASFYESRRATTYLSIVGFLAVRFRSGVQRGSRPFAGFGVSPNNSFSLFCSPPAAARKKKEKIWGHPKPRQEAMPPAPPKNLLLRDTPRPSKGRLPFAIPLLRRMEKYRTPVRKIWDDSYQYYCDRWSCRYGGCKRHVERDCGPCNKHNNKERLSKCHGRVP